MGWDEVRTAVAAAGLDVAEYGWGDDAQSLRWTLREGRSQASPNAPAWLLGGTDHDVWLTWREFGRDAEGLSALIASLWELRRRDAPARILRTLAETAQAAALGVQMMDRAAGWSAATGGSDSLPATEAKVGTPFDHVGDESGHVLHHFGTPWQERALPDAAHQRPIAGYLLVHQLQVGCRVERTPAAHGQPGGAWRVVLDRPIAEYVEKGALRPFVAKDA